MYTACYNYSNFQFSRALGASARAPSPTFVDRDETTDYITFQPELNVIVQEIAEQSHRGGSQAPIDGEHQHLVLSVQWHPHPLNPNGHEEKWEYKIDRVRISCLCVLGCY